MAYIDKIGLLIYNINSFGGEIMKADTIRSEIVLHIKMDNDRDLDGDWYDLSVTAKYIYILLIMLPSYINPRTVVVNESKFFISDVEIISFNYTDDGYIITQRYDYVNDLDITVNE